MKMGSNGLFLKELMRALDETREKSLFRELRLIGPEDETLLFADNDYLGLSKHPRLIEAFKKAADRYGTGAGASRLISGTSPAHEALEKGLAGFKKKEAALVFGSGYTANLALVSALAGEDDLIVIDKLDHASIIDACRLSGATLRVYPHKNLKKLEDILQKAVGFRRKWIITDSVFSMDGDLAPLEEIVKLKEKYEALLMIDEAHGTGVFGKNGRGVAEHLGVEDGIDVSMGTLSKAVGVYGGFVTGSRVLIDYLINFARPFIFATSLPPAVAAACLEGIKLIHELPELRVRLWKNIQYVHNHLSNMGLELQDIRSPILPIHVGPEEKAIKLSKFFLEKGIFIPAIRYPTVAKGKARLRLTLSARHTESDFERLFNAFRDARKLL